jgi:hypothetical protein
MGDKCQFPNARKRKRLKIYIASSFRNKAGVQMLQNELAKRHTVYDWTTKAPPVPAHLTPEQRRAELDKDEHGKIFKFCTDACKAADLLIYYGEAGKDAACEVALAYAEGATVIGLAGPFEAPGTILDGMVSLWVPDVRALIMAVDALASSGTLPEKTGKKDNNRSDKSVQYSTVPF